MDLVRSSEVKSISEGTGRLDLIFTTNSSMPKSANNAEHIILDMVNV